MAIRIYSLAKDLGLDSKELVDLCARIGIQGKGSALASLEDDEIARIKKHLEEKAAPPPTPAKEVLKPQREGPKEAPIRELGTRSPAPRRDLSSIRAKMGGADRTGSDSSTTAVAERAPTTTPEAPTTVETVESTGDASIQSAGAGDAVETTEVTPSEKIAARTGSENRGREDFYSPENTHLAGCIRG